VRTSDLTYHHLISSTTVEETCREKQNLSRNLIWERKSILNETGANFREDENSCIQKHFMGTNSKKIKALDAHQRNAKFGFNTL
jgi:hypothetical protein